MVRDRKRESTARKWIESVNGPGTANDYISTVDAIRPGDQIGLCCRVSGHVQEKNENLDDQEANLRSVAASLGATVVKVIRHVGSGTDPAWLAEAADFARANGIKLLAETTDRFIRHADYHSNKNPDAQANEQDLRYLRYFTNSVTLVTALHPDSTPSEARSYQSKRGQVQKGRKGGRPKTSKPGDTKRRGQIAMSKVFWMTLAGMTTREQAKILKVCPNQVQRWKPPYREQ